MKYKRCETLEEVLAIPNGATVYSEVYDLENDKYEERPVWKGEDTMQVDYDAQGRVVVLSTEFALAWNQPEDWQPSSHCFLVESYVLYISLPVAE